MDPPPGVTPGAPPAVGRSPPSALAMSPPLGTLLSSALGALSPLGAVASPAAAAAQAAAAGWAALGRAPVSPESVLELSQGPPKRKPNGAYGRAAAKSATISYQSPKASGRPTTPSLRLSTSLLQDSMTPRSVRSPQEDSPRTRLGRKSLTRIANRVMEDLIKPGGECTPTPREEAIEVCSNFSFSGVDLEADFSGDDLTSELFREMQRRKSRGRASDQVRQLAEELLPSGPSSGMFCSTLMTLTPVSEKGETPLRIRGGDALGNGG